MDFVYMRLASSRIFLSSKVYSKMRRFQFLQLSLSVLLLCCCGCSGSSGNFGNVQGTVTLDGKPLSGVSVVFYPESGERSSTGETDENGKYSLRHTRKIDGAVIGKHRITISINDLIDLYEDGGAEVTTKKRKKLPLKYTDQNKTELSETVESGNNTIDFPLKSK